MNTVKELTEELARLKKVIADIEAVPCWISVIEINARYYNEISCGVDIADKFAEMLTQGAPENLGTVLKAVEETTRGTDSVHTEVPIEPR